MGQKPSNELKFSVEHIILNKTTKIVLIAPNLDPKFTFC